MKCEIQSSVYLRITPKCKDMIEILDKQHQVPKEIRFINRNTNQFQTYHFDSVFEKQVTNQKLYRKIVFPPFLDSIRDLDSTIYCLLGPQGAGKKYTMTGEIFDHEKDSENNPGILTLLIKDAFKQNDSIKKLPKTPINTMKQIKVQMRALQIFNETVQNLGFQMIYGQSKKQRQFGSTLDFSIDLKSVQHFQNCIEKIYACKKLHTHLVIEVQFKYQTSIYTNKKTKFTFILLSSASCDQGSIHSQKIKNQVETLITIFQNIQKIKHLQHIFQSSKLAKTLKSNFVTATKVYMIGILDNSFNGNSSTLRLLKMSSQVKQDKMIIEGIKQDIKKEEEYLKNLTEKHKKVMNLLSKCVGMQLNFFQKQKSSSNSKRQFESTYGNSFNKKRQKMQFANIKKQQNEEQIQKINKQIAQVQNQIANFQTSYKSNLKKLQQEKEQLITKRNSYISQMEEYAEQFLKKNFIGSNKNSTHQINPQKLPFQSTFRNSKNQNYNDFQNQRISFKKEESLKNSFENSTLKNLKIQTDQLISVKQISKKLQRRRYSQEPVQQRFQSKTTNKQNMVKSQIKRQIYELFHLISQQEKVLASFLQEKIDTLPIKTVNKIKDQQKNEILTKMDPKQLQKILKQGKQFSLKEYQKFTENQKIHKKLLREMQIQSQNNHKKSS